MKISYEAFLAEVAAFKRSNVVGLATSMLWTVWKHPECRALPKNTPDGQAVHFLCAYAARIAAIAAAIGQEDGRPLTAQGMSALCQLYQSIEEREIAEEERLLVEQQESRDPFRKMAFSNAVTRLIAAFMPMHRNLGAQNIMPVGRHDVARSWHILKLADQHALRHHPSGLIEAGRKVLNGIAVDEFLRAGLTFLMLAGQTAPKGVDVRGCSFPDGLDEKLGVTNDSILFVADRLSVSTEELRDGWHAATLALPSHERKFSREPWSAAAPLLRLDPSFEGTPKDSGHYLCPSPWHLVLKLAQLPFEIVKSVESRQDFQHLNLQTHLGFGIEDFLHEMLVRWCGAKSVVRIDELIGEQDRRGDLIAFVNGGAILVESTKSLGTPEMRSSFSPKQLFDLWTVLFNKVRQCEATRQHPSFQQLLARRGVASVSSIVCLYDPVNLEGATFSQVAQVTGLLDVTQTEIVGIRQFEDLVDHFHAQQIHELVRLKWSRGHVYWFSENMTRLMVV